ncbi:type II toxin-antitoxin system PemK/MazF family toxin [Nocardioides sp. WL0053]|uniref:Type II toxin-antitoxin system PemK/MazF family toxin n=1 Tax=Nocardioides jiangsuensis TaxID=2866161 RepID=A0ABS7RM27_9ACTN|nr:type II toxin-antitoxin system PemK/MazF family toxin [Nocardioides jiangsuensis]MBY9076113.1 type II toxin-antitoxin system PemK/MazF family toxin [Nocardioides jiangsuensis]
MNRLANKLRSFLRPTTGTSTRAATAPSTGPVVEYAPEADGQPDPGEVVWAWVAYEDDPSQGKDRPVLVIGRDGDTLLALQLSSQDHDLDAEDEARYGRYWMDVGTGGWDAERRPSEVRLDRLLRMRQDEVRREGAILDRAMFDAVVREARGHHDLP